MAQVAQLRLGLLTKIDFGRGSDRERSNQYYFALTFPAFELRQVTEADGTTDSTDQHVDRIDVIFHNSHSVTERVWNRWADIRFAGVVPESDEIRQITEFFHVIADQCIAFEIQKLISNTFEKCQKFSERANLVEPVAVFKSKKVCDDF